MHSSSPLTRIDTVVLDGDVQTLSHLLPVDNLHHLTKEHRSCVLVIKIVGVLPHIHVEEGNNFGVDVGRHVLVECGHDLEAVLALVVHEPAPATALHSDRAQHESLLEVVDRAPSLQQVSVELVLWIGSVAVSDWAETFPEKLMVEVTAPIEFERLHDFNLSLDVILGNGLLRLHNQLV